MIEKKKQDADLAQSGDALKRAGQRARETAVRTHTPLVTYKDGHVQKRMIVREKGSEGEYRPQSSGRRHHTIERGHRDDETAP